MFVYETYFKHFTIAIKIGFLILAIFQSFHWFVGFIFDKFAPSPQIYVSKDVLNHFLVHSSAKNVLCFLFCILVDKSMKGLTPPPTPPPTLLKVILTRNTTFQIFSITFSRLQCCIK